MALVNHRALGLVEIRSQHEDLLSRLLLQMWREWFQRRCWNQMMIQKCGGQYAREDLGLSQDRVCVYESRAVERLCAVELDHQGWVNRRLDSLIRLRGKPTKRSHNPCTNEEGKIGVPAK